MLEKSLGTCTQRQLHRLDTRMRLAAGKLNTVSPLATLQRGYAIVSNAEGHVVTDATEVNPGDVIETRLSRGSLQARVETITPHRDDENP